MNLVKQIKLALFHAAFYQAGRWRALNSMFEQSAGAEHDYH
jgi:hypothetical protein